MRRSKTLVGGIVLLVTAVAVLVRTRTASTETDPSTDDETSD